MFIPYWKLLYVIYLVLYTRVCRYINDTKSFRTKKHINIVQYFYSYSALLFLYFPRILTKLGRFQHIPKLNLELKIKKNLNRFFKFVHKYFRICYFKSLRVLKKSLKWTTRTSTAFVRHKSVPEKKAVQHFLRRSVILQCSQM